MISLSCVSLYTYIVLYIVLYIVYELYTYIPSVRLGSFWIVQIYITKFKFVFCLYMYDDIWIMKLVNKATYLH